MEKLPLTVIIPTYNEEKNIIRALESCSNYVDQVLIADSKSLDNTISLALNYTNNIDVIQIINYSSFSDKMNQALKSSSIRNIWIMRLDADEVVVDPPTFFESLATEISNKNQQDVGFFIVRRYYFMNQWVKNGGMYPRYVLRIWKKDKAFFDSRLLDEKMILEGDYRIIKIEVADINQSGFRKWFSKHKIYAQREALQSNLLNLNETPANPFDESVQKNKNLYYKLPLLIRPVIYFFYRFIIMKGYKDRLLGMFYHLVHGLVYREMVDYFILKKNLYKVLKKLGSIKN